MNPGIKKILEEAYADLIRRGRERVGGPPTPEEVVAYSRGELPEAEAARFQERLAYYPDIARILSEEEPPPGDEERLITPEQMAEDWASILERFSRKG